MSEQIGITVTNTCYECMVIERDRLAGFQGGSMCQACVEAKEGRDDTIAYNLVDDGNDIYRYAPMYTSLTKLTPEPSGHDWTSSESAIGIQRWQARMTEEWDDNCKLVKMAVEFVDKDDPWLIRKEFTPPIAQLMDGGTYEELWELDDYTQRQRETECRWCHILTPKAFNDCQSCDKPLENNLI
jgi:hypothetical protein